MPFQIEIVKMLRDKAGWRLPRTGAYLDDEATYRDSGVYTYLDNNGVTFRKYGEPPYGESTVVYDTNPFAWLIIWPLTASLRRHLKRRRAVKDVTERG
jgi:hypothetical protein